MSGAPITPEQKQQVIEAVAKGVHPQVACTAARLSNAYYRVLRMRARKGEPAAITFLADIEAAQAQSEIDAVAATHRAVQPIEQAEVYCQTCGQAAKVDPDTIAALAMRLHDDAKAKSLAADVAIKTLERRHPKRWSQKVVHTIAEEHDRLLRVCERILAPEVLERVYEAYLAGGESEDEARSDSGGQASGDMH